MKNTLKADLHVHIKNNIEKEELIDILKMAQKAKVKAIAFLDCNNVGIYNENQALSNLIKSGEINKYYSGELIIAVEMISTLGFRPLQNFNRRKYNC